MLEATAIGPNVSARLKCALERRLYPSTALRVKQLPVGDRDTIARWLRGEGAPSSDNLSDLIKFFWNSGDRGFPWEVLGIEPMPVCANEIAQEFAAVLKRRGVAA